MQCTCEKLGADIPGLAPVCIGNFWLFKDLPEETMAAMSSIAIRQRKQPGESIFLEGEDADTLFLIKGGRLKLSRLSENGDERILGFRKAGDFVGENILTDATSYPCSAWCQTDTLICGFTRQQFNQLVMDYPQVGLQIMKNMSERIAWLSDQLGSVTVTNIEERLYQVLCNVAKEQGRKVEDGYQLDFALTHEELSFLIGAHRVSVTRAMNGLKQAGRIMPREKGLLVCGDLLG